MDISRRWSEAQAPETSRQGVAPRMGRRTKNSCVPAGTRKIYCVCPGGYASLHHRLHSAAPTGARNNFTEFASGISGSGAPRVFPSPVRFVVACQ